MLARLTLDGLREELRTLDARDTWLKLNLAGRNPDDGMTAIAYDKGYFFLRMLEENVGRAAWDEFLRDYFNQHAFRSVTTEDFVAYLEQDLNPGVDITEWIYGPGLPDNCPEVQTAELLQVEKQAAGFLTGTPAAELQVESWTTHHWLHFLRTLPDSLTGEQMHHLDEAFGLTDSGNSEITHEWLLHVIATGYQPGMEKLEQFLTQQGRRKFLKPLYQKLAETDEGKILARQIYQKARPTYHAVSRDTIDELLR